MKWLQTSRSRNNYHASNYRINGGGGQVKKILKHLGLWDLKARSPTKSTGPPKPLEYTFDYSTSQLPDSDKWLYVDVEYPDSYTS